LTKPRFTLAAAVNNQDVLERNLLASPGLDSGLLVQTLLKEGATSASLAYNEMLDDALGDIVVFVHQDIYLPHGWFEAVAASIAALDAAGTAWGVLGCFGSRMHAAGGLGRVYTHGLGLHGNAVAAPEPVETLDEIVLILRKSSGLRFDPKLPHFHMYGSDICLTARARGLANFVVPAFCIHNTNQLMVLPQDFYDCFDHVKQKWARYLPIATACVTMTRWGGPLLRKRAEETVTRLRGQHREALRRVDDPRALLPEAFWERLAADPRGALASPAPALAQARTAPEEETT